MHESGDPRAESSPSPANVISLVGPSNSGKTTLICRLVAWLRARALTVAVVKHSHKAIQAKSQIAWTYRQAGARAVAQTGTRLMQVNRYAPGDPDLREILAFLCPQADLVIVEGYKTGFLPQIALTGPGLEKIPQDQSRVVAWVSRESAATPLPSFQPDEVEKIGLFILEFLGIVPGNSAHGEKG
jgi:molybdopterin-guanine dinucleotide biosynthesis protein B